MPVKGKIEKIKCDGCGEVREWIGYQCISACSCMLTDANDWENDIEEKLNDALDEATAGWDH